MNARFFAALRGLFALALLLPTLALTAQDGKPTLRDAPAGMPAQRHLLKSVYETVKYPKAALDARRGGAYALTIHVDENGSTWEAKPMTSRPNNTDAVNLVIKAPDQTAGATVSGQMKVNADRALIEETEKIGRYLVDIGFDPATQGDAPVSDSLTLVLYFQIEE